jgi:hypothetical protein
MIQDFSILDRLRLAFKVMMQWETLATLLAFVVFWLLVRYVADPWRNEGRPRVKMSAKRTKSPPAIVEEEEKPAGDDDDMLPD